MLQVEHVQFISTLSKGRNFVRHCCRKRQQCRSNIRLRRNRRNFTINSFDIVAVYGNNVECCFDKVERCVDIVAGVDGALCVSACVFSAARVRLADVRQGGVRHWDGGSSVPGVIGERRHHPLLRRRCARWTDTRTSTWRLQDRRGPRFVTDLPTHSDALLRLSSFVALMEL